MYKKIFKFKWKVLTFPTLFGYDCRLEHTDLGQHIYFVSVPKIYPGVIDQIDVG